MKSARAAVRWPHWMNRMRTEHASAVCLRQDSSDDVAGCAALGSISISTERHGDNRAVGNSSSQPDMRDGPCSTIERRARPALHTHVSEHCDRNSKCPCPCTCCYYIHHNNARSRSANRPADGDARPLPVLGLLGSVRGPRKDPPFPACRITLRKPAATCSTRAPSFLVSDDDIDN